MFLMPTLLLFLSNVLSLTDLLTEVPAFMNLIFDGNNFCGFVFPWEKTTSNQQHLKRVKTMTQIDECYVNSHAKLQYGWIHMYALESWNIYNISTPPFAYIHT